MFPGLACDHRFFDPQKSLPVEMETPEWIEPESERETLSHYADRLAERCGRGRYDFIGGASLGAMIALEATRVMDVTGLFLIGGCTSHRQIAALSTAALKLAARMPLGMIRPTLLAAPAALKAYEQITLAQAMLLTRLARANSPRQTRWSCRAILEWECDVMPPDARVHAIHGQHDPAIPVDRVKPEYIVPNGRHLISIANADQVNRFILKHLA